MNRIIQRRSFFFVLMLALVVGLSGCKRIKQMKEAAEKAKKLQEENSQTLTILTGSKTGNYYKAATELSGVMTDQKLDIKESAGSYANLQKLGSGQANLAIAQFDTVMMFLKMGPQFVRYTQNSVVVAPLSNEPIHIIVNKKAKIKKIADLKGKRIGAGSDTSGSFVSAFTIMSYFNDVNLQKYDKMNHEPYEQALEKLQNGELDVLFITTSPGMPLLKNLSEDAASKIALLDVGKDIKLPNEISHTYVVEQIAAGTYPWQKDEVNALSTPSYLLANAPMDAGKIRKLAKTLYGNADKLREKSDIWKLVSVERAKEDIANSIPYHSGARAFISTGS